MSNIKIQSFDGTNYTQQKPYSYFAENADKLDGYHASDFVLSNSYTPGIFSVSKIFDKNFSWEYQPYGSLSDSVTVDSSKKALFLIEELFVTSGTVIGSSSSDYGVITAGGLASVYVDGTSRNTGSISNQSATVIAPRMGNWTRNDSTGGTQDFFVATNDSHNTSNFKNLLIWDNKINFTYVSYSRRISSGNISGNIKLYAIYLM